MTDTCPSCCRRGISPARTRSSETQIVHTYRCPCGRQWLTARARDAYTTTRKDTA